MAQYKNYQFAVARCNPNGTLDTTFSGDGRLTTNFGDAFYRDNQAEAVAIDATGKIVAAGLISDSQLKKFALARYTTNGNLDTTFGGDGMITNGFSPDGAAGANALAIDANGKIVVAGYFDPMSPGAGLRFAVARYNANGTLDSTFSGDGMLTTDFTSLFVVKRSAIANAVAVDADGKIVAAGYVALGDQYQFAVARYNPNGELDTTFSSDGCVTTNFVDGPYEQANAIAIDASGKIVVAGYATIGGHKEFALARYNANGTLDTTFGGDGKITTDFTGLFLVKRRAAASAVAIDANGRIVAAGYVGFGTQQQFALARYNHDSTLDTTFAGDGLLTTDFGGSEAEGATAIAIDADDKIVVAGSAANGSHRKFAVARYNTDGTLDTSFSSDGRFSTTFPNTSTCEATAVAIDPNGKIVVAGYAADSDTSPQ